MGSFSDYLENEILDHILKVGIFPVVPLNIYVALSTADPLDDGSGVTEPSGGGYARVLCNTWAAAAIRVTSNTNTIQFAQATADWGNITHFALFDAITGGNMLAHGSLTTPRYISAGQTYSVAAGGLTISFEDGGVSDYLANALLDHIFKVSPYSPPANIYVAVSIATITDAMDGDSLSEPGGNYVRVTHNTWNAAVTGASDNNGAITFVEATSGWGRVTDGALLDAVTSGNLLVFGELDTALDLIIGGILRFADGDFNITLD